MYMYTRAYPIIYPMAISANVQLLEGRYPINSWNRWSSDRWLPLLGGPSSPNSSIHHCCKTSRDDEADHSRIGVQCPLQRYLQKDHGWPGDTGYHCSWLTRWRSCFWLELEEKIDLFVDVAFSLRLKTRMIDLMLKFMVSSWRISRARSNILGITTRSHRAVSNC